MKRLLYIGNKLSKHGNTATSIETLGAFLENEGYILYYSSSKKNKLLRMMEMIFYTFKYSKKIDYVLIDTYSTFNFWYAFIISQLCRLLKIKYIPKLHGGDLPNRIQRSKYFSDLIFKNSYINIAPSGYLYDNFLKNSYNKLIYIPNTIEIEKYPFSNRSMNHPRILWVRSFAKIYNPLLAIKVYDKILEYFPNAKLTMVGPKKDESFDEVIKYMTEKKLNVNITGKLSKDEWINLSKDYNVFLNTTHFDNTPVSVIEAMALGLPVVSTDVGGIPYLLKHNLNALLVEDDNLEKMVNEILRLFNENELSNNLTYNAYQLVKEFDWKVVKKEWFNLLK